MSALRHPSSCVPLVIDHLFALSSGSCSRGLPLGPDEQEGVKFEDNRGMARMAVRCFFRSYSAPHSVDRQFAPPFPPLSRFLRKRAPAGAGRRDLRRQPNGNCQRTLHRSRALRLQDIEGAPIRYLAALAVMLTKVLRPELNYSWISRHTGEAVVFFAQHHGAVPVFINDSS
jgi:hypothetical protein